MQPQGQGEQIGFAVTASPLGPLLVARTDAGVCAVCVADSEDELRAELHARYPAARLQRAQTALAGAMQRVLQTLHGSPAGPDLPWDLCCTPFQEAAWHAMERIPRGHTVTYQQLAIQLRRPGGQIAVGQACARNPLAILIPCHRVVAHGNHPHHWRWGLRRKIQLLALERITPSLDAAPQAPLQAELF